MENWKADQKIKQKVLLQAEEIRKKLHKYPELSGKEYQTKEILKEHFKELKPDFIYKNIGGNSIAFEFSAPHPENTILFRADMDALPIPDEIDADYKSEFQDIGHKCGHDGHMAILFSFALLLQVNPPERTKLILLFQAEEETGQGAEKIVNNDWFKNLKPDFVFGLHNLPGFNTNTVILKNGIFASSSVGMKIELLGRSSHAGQPEDGINPASAIARLINFLHKNLDYKKFRRFTLATIIHIKLGEIAFGTSPGKADFFLTLRAEDEIDLDKLIQIIESEVKSICNDEKLKFGINFTEKFPSTENDAKGYELVKIAAKESALEMIEIPEAFRWSEDFGHYLKYSSGAFFGIGAGIETPRLHNPDYDFPDEIILSGVDMFFQLFTIIDKG
jgi:amidohydrolase